MAEAEVVLGRRSGCSPALLPAASPAAAARQGRVE
jgi:hypothetical protein